MATENIFPPLVNAYNGSLYPFPEWLYLKFHMELTLLSFLRTKDLDAAQDIASDCLSNWWEKAGESSNLIICKQMLITQMAHFCQSFKITRRKISVAEAQFQSDRALLHSIYNASFIEKRLDVLHYLPNLNFYEREVIRLQLEEEQDLAQISALLGKPLSAIKLLHDRAIYQLKKHFQPAALPLHQFR